MMIVCIQNKVPLFLIGKPGSSKSLAKSMVMNALQGKMSSSGLFKQMKRVSLQKILHDLGIPSSLFPKDSKQIMAHLKTRTSKFYILLSPDEQ